MTTKSNFTEQEWAAVADAPHLAAGAVMVAGASGVIGSVKEAFAAGQKVIAGAKDTNSLIRELSNADEVKSMQTRLKDALNEHRGDDARKWIATEAIARVRQSIQIVQQKAPAELDDYKHWIMDVADSVAKAAKEGGFLGFGGERVSKEEQRMLNELRAALGLG